MLFAVLVVLFVLFALGVVVVDSLSATPACEEIEEAGTEDWCIGSDGNRYFVTWTGCYEHEDPSTVEGFRELGCWFGPS